MTFTKNIFDRLIVKKHRDRALSNYFDNNFLFLETASRLTEKLDEITKPFKLGLNLGCHSGEIESTLSARYKDTSWFLTELSPQLAKLAYETKGSPVAVMDEELIGFKEKTFDLVVSNLSLHWVNDLPGTLKQIYRILKPDGLLIATLLGENTLFELKQSLNQAEIETENGISPRISPFTRIRDAGDLLIRTGFALPVADVERITVYYPNAFKLMRDLRFMGESYSILSRRKTFTRRSTIFRAAEIYQTEFKDKNDKIPASFDVVSILGWVPHKNQQQPLKRGSGQINLEKAINL